MDPALKTMIDNMPEKTGKSLAEWKKILIAKSFQKHGEAVRFLKVDHGVSHGFANTIVTLSRDNNETAEDLVKNQYKGKEELKPIYEKLLEMVNKLGADVIVTPKKGSVSIIRKRQFALIKPATKTRIDLGLKLVGKELTERLQNSGPFGSMCTHRVQISDVNDIDNELKEWIREAYTKSK
jgi:hypothetical protein